jgi:hypothetical protein
MLRVNNLVGFGAGQSSVGTLTYIDETIENDGTDPSPAIPALAAAGDLCVCWSGPYSVITTPVWQNPSGWTIIANAASANYRPHIVYKVLVAGDLGTSPQFFQSGVGASNVMFVFRPSRPIVSVTLSTWNIEATSGNPAQQTIDASPATNPFIVLGGMGSINANPGGLSLQSPAFEYTANSTTNSYQTMGYTIYNTGVGASHDVDVGDTGAQTGLQCGYIEVTM